MQQYSIQKTGKQYVGAEGSRVAVKGPPCSNADVLAKAILDIKLILDIEKALADGLNFGKPRNSQPVQDQILTIIDEADAVAAAQRIQAGFRGLKVVK